MGLAWSARELWIGHHTFVESTAYMKGTYVKVLMCCWAQLSSMGLPWSSVAAIREEHSYWWWDTILLRVQHISMGLLLKCQIATEHISFWWDLLKVQWQVSRQSTAADGWTPYYCRKHIICHWKLYKSEDVFQSTTPFSGTCLMFSCSI